MKAEAPFYHANEEGRWDYRVTITWKNSVVAHDDYDDSVNSKKLFPDQDTFKREEQRRFEILLGHCDVAVVAVNLDKP
jgi:nitric oxide reductase activation protein